MKTLVLVFAAAFAASAQTAPVAESSPCDLLSRYKYIGEQKALLKLRCELEMEQVRQAIRDAKGLAKSVTPSEPGPIGVAAKNGAVTKVTYRNAKTGEAYEGSAGWKEVRLAEIKGETKVAVEEAKSSRLQGCPWYGCSVAYGYGYGGYSGSYAGSYGYNRGGSVTTSCGEGGCNKVF